jgi:3' exoribonuclease family, domain 2
LFVLHREDADGPVMFVVDPSWKEEQVMDGCMTVTLNAFREICAVQKAGGVPISVSTLLECNRVAAVKAKELLQVVKRALGEDEKPPVLFHPAPVSAVPELSDDMQVATDDDRPASAIPAEVAKPR